MNTLKQELDQLKQVHFSCELKIQLEGLKRQMERTK